MNTSEGKNGVIRSEANLKYIVHFQELVATRGNAGSSLPVVSFPEDARNTDFKHE